MDDHDYEIYGTLQDVEFNSSREYEPPITQSDNTSCYLKMMKGLGIMTAKSVVDFSTAAFDALLKHKTEEIIQNKTLTALVGSAIVAPLAALAVHRLEKCRSNRSNSGYFSPPCGLALSIAQHVLVAGSSLLSPLAGELIQQKTPKWDQTIEESCSYIGIAAAVSVGLFLLVTCANLSRKELKKELRPTVASPSFPEKDYLSPSLPSFLGSFEGDHKEPKEFTIDTSPGLRGKH